MEASARPSIVPAAAADLPAIAELAGMTWRAHYPGIISPAQIEYMLARMYALDVLERELEQGIRYDRALAENALIGFAAHGLVNPGEVKLHKLYIHPRWQRRGAGTLLLRHVETVARDAGCKAITLTVNKRNDGAIAAYERNGYAIRTAVVADIGGGFVMDDYVMAKTLDRTGRDEEQSD